MRADMRSKITIKYRPESLLPSLTLYPFSTLQPFQKQNSYGEELTWTDFTTVWGSVEPLLGNEFFKAETYESKVEIKFRCYFFNGVTNDMRVSYAGTDYDILSAINVKNLNREYLIYAKRVEL